MKRSVVNEPLVLIEWVDSARTDGWAFTGDIRKTPHRCVSVGYAIRSDETALVLVPTLAENKDGDWDQGLGTVVIPREAVKRVTKLKNPLASR